MIELLRNEELLTKTKEELVDIIRVKDRIIKELKGKELKKTNGKRIRVNVFEKGNKVQGSKPEIIVSLLLTGMQMPDSVLARDVDILSRESLRHAKEQGIQAGYQKLTGIYCDGKEWWAKFEMEKNILGGFQ